MSSLTASKNLLKEITKLQQKKYRDKLNLFMAEGNKVFEEMLNFNADIVYVFTINELNNSKINCPIYKITESEMKKISSTESVCEILTIAKKKKVQIEEFLKLDKIILLDSVSDPGNLGTIIRSAAAFGVEGIILFGNCTDLYSAKVIRSCAGNFFKIPILQINTIMELKKYFPEHIKIATALSQENNIDLNICRNIKKRIIMFGSEAKGLNDELIKLADKNIKLEMKNNVESLNLAVCSSIVMYETQ